MNFIWFDTGSRQGYGGQLMRPMLQTYSPCEPEVLLITDVSLIYALNTASDKLFGVSGREFSTTRVPLNVPDARAVDLRALIRIKANSGSVKFYFVDGVRLWLHVSADAEEVTRLPLGDG